jgi:putative glycosyltransferase (TIGR04372 family)
LGHDPKFFIGSSSGLWNLASIFGVPSALTNMIPLSTLGYSPKDLSIPKLLKKTTNGQVLKFSDAFSNGLSNLRTASAYIRNEIEPVENNSEDILSLVMDIYESINTKDFNINESLQIRFRKHMKSNEYGFKSRANLGPRFLEKYKNLM